MPRPLLFSPDGAVLAAEPTSADREAMMEALLVEIFGLLQGAPKAVRKWQPHGGMKGAVQALSDAIVHLVGKERLEREHRIMITVQEEPPSAGPEPVEGQTA